MNTIKVLIVDDEIEFASTLAERLELRNFKTVVMNNGEDALASVNHDPPDVVVLDLKMPTLDGLDVLKGIKSINPEVEVIILTGHGSTAAGIEGMKKGAFDYIMKPVDLLELIEKINQAYAKRQAGRSMP